MRSPTVSSESHLTLTFLPSRSFAMTSIITIVVRHLFGLTSTSGGQKFGTTLLLRHYISFAKDATNRFNALQDCRLHHHVATSFHLIQTLICIPFSRLILSKYSLRDLGRPSHSMRLRQIGEPNGWHSMKHDLFEFGYRLN